jgi:bifunctional non-homologous end joining protein LigD
MTAMPRWIPPQLTRLVDAAPEGDSWLHEIKYDGYRMHGRLDQGAVKLLTRTGLHPAKLAAGDHPRFAYDQGIGAAGAACYWPEYL